MTVLEPSAVHGQGLIEVETPGTIVTTQTNEYSIPAQPPVLPPDGNLGLTEGAPHPVFTGKDLPDSSIAIDSHKQAWQQLTSRTIPQDELSSLIETIFSDRKAIKTVDPLQKGDAQAFIDVIDRALGSLTLTPHVQKNCVKSLYRACARHSLLPESLQIKVQYEPTTFPHSRGGFADVWKGIHGDREVAVKVLRTDSKSDIQKIVRVFCKEFVTWKALKHPNVLTLLGVMVTEDRFAMVSEWMIYGNINQFVTTHRDANRFELLGGVAKGLIYMHGQGMIHGDLKGLNILVDQTCRARLADFGLLTITSDSTTLNSSTHGGTPRWMSPELLGPEVKDYRRTVYSDCYALGMVIYEVLTERTPFYQFYQCSDMAISWKILGGARPERPEGAERGWFTNEVWEILGRCWVSQPGDRPTIEDILQCLEKVSGSWTPPPVPPVAAGSLTQESTDIIVLEDSDMRTILSPSEVTLHQPPVTQALEEATDIVNRTLLPNDFGEHPPLRASDLSPAEGLLGEPPTPKDFPLFKSRQIKWINNPNPKHDSSPIPYSGLSSCLIFSHERIILAKGSSIYVYSPHTSQLTMTLHGHEWAVWVLSATKDVLASGSNDQTVRIWDLNTGRCTHIFRGHGDDVHHLAIVNPELVEVTGGDGVVCQEMWPKRPMFVSAGRESLHVWLLPKPNNERQRFGNGEDWVYPAQEDVNESPFHRFHLQGHKRSISTFAARGRTLVSGSSDGCVRVWDIITGECKWIFTGQDDLVISVVLDPTRNIACSCSSSDHTVRVWDLNTGTERFALTGHTSRVNRLQLYGPHLASESSDSTRVWNPDTGKMKHTLAVRCPFQHNESKLLSASRGIVQIWDLSDGSVIRNLQLPEEAAIVLQIAFNDRWCAVVHYQSGSYVMHVWDFGTEVVENEDGTRELRYVPDCIEEP